jgi:hypothetical protein
MEVAPYGKYKDVPMNQIPREYLLTLVMNQEGHQLIDMCKEEILRREKSALVAAPGFTTISTHYNFFRPAYLKFSWEKPETPGGTVDKELIRD